jgi:hypothetical protein
VPFEKGTLWSETSSQSLVRIDTYLLQMGFEKSDANPNLYYIIRGEDTLILILYVDDLFITGAEDLIAECKLRFASEFEMSDIGLMHYFLGMEVWQEEGHIFLEHGKYAADILSRFQMEDCRPMSTPMVTNWKKLSASDSQLVDAIVYRQLIGSLMYLVNTRSDICFAVNTLSQRAEGCSLDWGKTCVEVHCWDN